jgi:hypothetical protein
MLFVVALFLQTCSAPGWMVCTCIQRSEPRTVLEARAALASTDAVFSGEVLRTTLRRDSTRAATVRGDSVWFRYETLVATMAVREVWRGQVPDTVDVETPAQTTMCGADLEAGRYLIDGERSGEATFVTSKCGWTRPLSRARDLLALLRLARS